VKRREFEQHLAAHGCMLAREGARHSVFRNRGNGMQSTVPRHTELKRGLIIKICKDLEIPDPFKNG